MNTLGRALFLKTAVAVAIGSLLGAACGKDKPAEQPTEAEPAAVGEEDKPAEAEPAEGEAGHAAAKKEGEEAAPGGDPKTSPDDPKARLRAARERAERGERPERPGRRPRPVRDGNGAGMKHAEPGAVDPDAEPGTLEPHEPIDGVVGELPTPPVPGTPTPTPDAPSVVEEQPTPSVPAVIPAPGDPGMGEPGGPAFEIRNDAAAIDAGRLLPLTTVTEVVGKPLAAGVPLPGIAIAAGYGSIVYAATADPKSKGGEAFGVALQVWQDPTRRETEDRFRRMRLQYPNAEDVSVLLPLKGFYAYFGTVQSLTWVDPAKRMVVSLSCGEGLCNHDAMTRLAKSARERM